MTAPGLAARAASPVGAPVARVPGGEGFPLNDRQQAAVDHGGGPLVVLAGAGTGKTRVLVARIARLIEIGVASHEILAVTFTNKAADEMRGRLREMFGEIADAMWIGTFHATSARLLRRYGEVIGVPRDFSIVDDGDQARIIRRLIRAAGLDAKVSAGTILSRIDHAKNRGIDPGSIEDSFTEAVQRVFPEYEAELRRMRAVDFNDLIMRAIDLFEMEPAASAMAGKFQHVLVDEFQDTNLIQYQLVRALAKRTGNLFAVGDDDQSIYAWRGAEPENLRGLETGDLGRRARLIKLEENYRSTQVVLDAANGVIDRGKGRHKKVLWTRKVGGARLEIYGADDDRGEARFVVRRVADLVRGGARMRDVAILFRTNAQARLLEEQLRVARIGVRVVGSTSFFDREEVKDALAYLKIAAHPALDAAFERAIGAPSRGVGEKTIERMRAKAKFDRTPLIDAARAAARGSLPDVGKRQSLAIASFLSLIDQIAADAVDGRSVAWMVERVVNESGLRAAIEADAESADRIRNLEDLALMASDFDEEVRRSGGRAAGVPGEVMEGKGETHASSTEERSKEASKAVLSLSAEPAGTISAESVEVPNRLLLFLERAALVQPDDVDLGRRAWVGSDDDRVSLMTVHVAKGLEWPIVFVVGLEDGLFPSLREREEAGPGYDALEEERRLMYVAITRARERLVLTHARSRRVHGEVLVREPSRFFDDLPRHCWSAVDASGKIWLE